MKTLSVAQMREADRRCIKDLGIPGVVLMENAGRAVFQEIERGPVGIVCGKGNNGGDGFVVARHALLAGFETHVLLLSDTNSICGDAGVFMRAYQNLGGEIQVLQEGEADSALKTLNGCTVLVDAILGTGVSGEVRGICREVIDAWPSVATIAVDLPSGLDADSGQICGNCISAATTVTFQFAKRGFLTAAAKEVLGRLVVADIGIPAVCADDEAWSRFMTGKL